MIRIFVLCLFLSLFFTCSMANTEHAKGFDVIALGTGGGLNTHNLPAFLIAPHGQAKGISCDAGSLVSGINAAIKTKSFSPEILPPDSEYTLSAYILRDYIKGYLISHAHLDHVAGLIIASPDDSSKTIYALEPVLHSLSQNYFNWDAWPNFSNKGKQPHLQKYRYSKLHKNQSQSISNTPMRVRAFPLSHNGGISSAFLIEYQEDTILCVGDTGPDSVEKSMALANLWENIAPQINQGKLKAIIIESSFNNSRPDKLLFGHLSPKYIHQEFGVLASLLNNADLLQGLPVIISHIKPSIKKDVDIRQVIKRELNANNQFKLDFILPQQGQKWTFQ